MEGCFGDEGRCGEVGEGKKKGIEIWVFVEQSFEGI